MTKAERHYTMFYRKERPDRTMTECYWDARRRVHFVATFTADMKAHAKRSKAAKAAWKRRKAAA